MSAPSPTISNEVLQQLITWVRGFLEQKHALPESRPRTLSLDLWTGFQLALTELWSLRQRELIEWQEVADRLPDAETSVLYFAPDSSEPVWIGWFDGTDWYDVGGCIVEDVVRWAHLPAGGIADAGTPS